MPLKLAVGATPVLIGSFAPPLPSLTATQRVHPPHLPSSLGLHYIHLLSNMYVCIYYCSTYYKAVRVGGGG
jgi:hypothetical protein